MQSELRRGNASATGLEMFPWDLSNTPGNQKTFCQQLPKKKKIFSEICRECFSKLDGLL